MYLFYSLLFLSHRVLPVIPAVFPHDGALPRSGGGGTGRRSGLAKAEGRVALVVGLFELFEEG
jgi:hypothetical protein